MTSKITTTILGLLTIGSLAFAGYLYTSQLGGNGTQLSGSPTPISTVETTPLDESVVASPTPTVTLSPSRAFSENQSLGQPNQVETVSEGGSLSSIASAHGLSIMELARLNGLSDPNKVLVGQSIIVPDVASSNTYVILFVLNEAREKKEAQRLATGQASRYSDPILAAQSDIAGIYGLSADTPYSKSSEATNLVTLSTTLEGSIVTTELEKQASNLWLVKKLTIKLQDNEGET